MGQNLAIVTGTSRGIGKAVAEQLTELGACAVEGQGCSDGPWRHGRVSIGHP